MKAEKTPEAESSDHQAWVYFTLEATLNCNEYERILGDSDPNERFSVVLPRAQDMLVTENMSQPVQISVPIHIYFRMPKSDADTVLDAAIKLGLEEHFRRYCTSLGAMEGEDPDCIDILERVQSVSISGITRSIEPSPEYEDLALSDVR